VSIYADTSVLFSLYVTDANSPRADAWRQPNPAPIGFTLSGNRLLHVRHAPRQTGQCGGSACSTINCYAENLHPSDPVPCRAKAKLGCTAPPVPISTFHFQVSGFRPPITGY